MPRPLIGALLAALGGGCFLAALLLAYFPDEHNRELFTLGLPGDLLFALLALVVFLGGLGLAFSKRPNGAGR